jgi:hypothetical protein
LTEKPGQGGRADLVSFATLGTIITAQQLSVTFIGAVSDADPELVAEEALGLVATVTARVLDGPASRTIIELPLLYRDYAIGGAMLEGDTLSSGGPDSDPYRKSSGTMAFYQAHFPAGQAPGREALQDKMELWMGRISPPGLPESPGERLERLGLVGVVATHLRLVRTMAQPSPV